MNKLFSDSEEKFVNAEIFYASKTDSKLYSDDDCAVAAKAEEVYNAFLKGLLVVTMEDSEGLAQFRPIVAVPTYSSEKLTGVEIHAIACDGSGGSGVTAVCNIFTA